MNRLTPFARIVIVALILGLAFLGYRKYVAPKMGAGIPTEQITDDNNEATTNNNNASEENETTNK